MQPRVILLSGASKGIGSSIRKLLYNEDCFLSLGVRDVSTLEKELKSEEKDKLLLTTYNAFMGASSKMEPHAMIQAEDIAALVKTILTLPNNASVAELSINCVRHELY